MFGIGFGIGVLAGTVIGAVLLRIGMGWHERIVDATGRNEPAFGGNDTPIRQSVTGEGESQDEDVA